MVVAVAALWLGCGESSLDLHVEQAGRSRTPDQQVSVVVELSSEGVRVIGRAERTAAFAGAPDGRSVSWVFLDEMGHLLAQNDIADPRLDGAEYFDGAQLRRVEGPVGAGLVTLSLPAAEGTLIISEPTLAGSRELGRTAVAPVLTGSSSLSLMSPADVVTGSTRIRGAGAKAVDLLFVPEGYTDAELPKFRSDVAALLNELLTATDYSRHSGKIGALRADIRSRQSGIDDTDNAVAVDTAFDVGWGVPTRRCIWFNTAAGYAAVQTLKQQANARAAVVVVNTGEFGGCAGGEAVTVSRWDLRLGAQVLAHELGHVLFKLGDEYACQGTPPNLSMTSNRALLPWADMVSASTPVPTPVAATYTNAVGAFPIASCWRPQLTCMMGALGPTFCGVCKREMDRHFGSAHPPPTCVASVSPAAGGVGTLFTATLGSTGASTCSYKLDGGPPTPINCLTSFGVLGSDFGGVGDHHAQVTVVGPGGSGGCALGWKIHPAPTCLVTISPSAGRLTDTFTGTLMTTGATRCSYRLDGASAQTPLDCNAVLSGQGSEFGGLGPHQATVAVEGPGGTTSCFAQWSVSQ